MLKLIKLLFLSFVIAKITPANVVISNVECGLIYAPDDGSPNLTITRNDSRECSLSGSIADGNSSSITAEASASITSNATLDGYNGSLSVFGTFTDRPAIFIAQLNTYTVLGADQSATIYTDGEQRPGFALLKWFGIQATTDGQVTGQGTFNDVTYSSLGFLTGSGPFTIPVSLGGPIALDVRISATCRSSYNTFCDSDTIGAGIEFNLFESNGMAVAFSETLAPVSTPEPSSTFLTFCLVLAFGVIFRRRLPLSEA